MYATEPKNAFFGQILTKTKPPAKVLKNVRKQNRRNAIILSLFMQKSEYCFSTILSKDIYPTNVFDSLSTLIAPCT
jgi:hypothetical protein